MKWPEKARHISYPATGGSENLSFKALFSGSPDPDGQPRGLFSELWIGQRPDYGFTQKYPVISLSMPVGYDAPEDLKTAILKDVKKSDYEDFRN